MADVSLAGSQLVRYVNAVDASGANLTGKASGDFTAKCVVQGGTLQALTVDAISILGSYGNPATGHVQIKELSSSAPSDGVYEVHISASQAGPAGGKIWILFGVTGGKVSRLEVDLVPYRSDVQTWLGTAAATPAVAGVPTVTLGPGAHGGNGATLTFVGLSWFDGAQAVPFQICTSSFNGLSRAYLGLAPEDVVSKASADVAAVGWSTGDDGAVVAISSGDSQTAVFGAKVSPGWWVRVRGSDGGSVGIVTRVTAVAGDCSTITVSPPLVANDSGSLDLYAGPPAATSGAMWDALPADHVIPSSYGSLWGGDAWLRLNILPYLIQMPEGGLAPVIALVPSLATYLPIVPAGTHSTTHLDLGVFTNDADPSLGLEVGKTYTFHWPGTIGSPGLVAAWEASTCTVDAIVAGRRRLTFAPAFARAITAGLAYSVSTAATGGGGGGGGLSVGGSVILAWLDGNAAPIGPVDFAIVGQGMARSTVGGTFAMTLADGTYTVRTAAKNGVLFADASLVVTSGVGSVTISGTAAAITPSSPGMTTGYLTCYDANGEAAPGQIVELRIVGAPGDSGAAIDNSIRSATSDSNGLVSFANLIYGSRFQVKYEGGAWSDHGTVPSSGDTFAIPDVIGH